MTHKESKLGSFGGRAEVASVDFINAVLEQDRKAKKHRGMRLYIDENEQGKKVLATDLLREIDYSDLDPTQELIVQALEQQELIPIIEGEKAIANSVTTREALRAFKSTPKYRERLATLQASKEGHESLNDPRSDFAGAIFADIAQIMYGSSINEGVLLSSRVTDSLYQDFYKGEIPLVKNYGERTLDRISVPDGIIVEVNNSKPKLTKFVEYSLAQKSEKYLGKLGAYAKSVDDFRYKSSDSISSDFQIDFVVPRPSWGLDYPKLDSSNQVKADYHVLPIEALAFGQELDDILADQFKLTYTQKSRSKYS